MKMAKVSFHSGKITLVSACILVPLLALAAPSPRKILPLIDKQFYYPQNHVKKGFKMRLKYSGADQFIKSKIDHAEGEKAGNYYVSYNRKKRKVEFDVSSITPRLAGAVRAILMEQKDSIVPRSISSSLKGYSLKTHKEGKFLKLYGYVDKKRYVKKRHPIVRVEYFLDKNYTPRRTHAFLATRERIDSKWDLKKNKRGLFLIKKNTMVIHLYSGKVVQQVAYEYKNVKGVDLPSKITIKSRFEAGRPKDDFIYFYDHQVF